MVSAHTDHGIYTLEEGCRKVTSFLAELDVESDFQRGVVFKIYWEEKSIENRVKNMIRAMKKEIILDIGVVGDTFSIDNISRSGSSY